ncbi:hypothetical protein J6590_074739 [Homalodisca vitripennis]|nr:hypothetical protein J6590_074739 [Homalodisca vitripennis]
MYDITGGIKEKWSKEKTEEDTDRVVVHLCRDELRVNLPASAISRSHWVGGKRKPSPDGSKRHRPIVVSLVSYQVRRTIYNNKKKLKEITVPEDLT